MCSLLLAALVSGSVGCASVRRENPEIAFVGVHVVPMNRDVVLADQTVVVRGERIVAVGPASRIVPSPGAFVIEGKGRYLIPGLADMHAHLPQGDGPNFTMEDYLFLNVARGVTTIRSMRGYPDHLRLRESIRSGAILGPALLLASPALTSDRDFTPAKARAAVAEYRTAGYDFIKLLGRVGPEAYEALVREARGRGIAIAGHAPPTGLAGAIRAGQASIEHIDPYLKSLRASAVDVPALLREQADKKLFACPDVYWYEVMWHQKPPDVLERTDGLAYVPQRLLSEWRADLKQDLDDTRAAGDAKLTALLAERRASIDLFLVLLKSMNDAGVPLLVSAGDGPFLVPGFDMLEEMRLFRKAGLTPYEVLKAATANAGRFLGRVDRGTIEVGKIADLVLLDSNPVEDVEAVARVEGVVLRGVWLPRGDIARRLAAIAENARH